MNATATWASGAWCASCQPQPTSMAIAAAGNTRQDALSPQAVHGLTTTTPVASNPLLSRVTMAAPRALQIAAMQAS